MSNKPQPEPISPEELSELFAFKNDPTQIVEGDGATTAWALAWFPKGEWVKATEKWPDLLDNMPADHQAYSRKIESHLKASAATQPGSPDVSPLSVDTLVERFADNAGEPLSRATMGAELSRKGQAISWPPGRNDQCWCQSGAKYKSCCGPVAAAE